jgi:hypothetical protein
LGLRRLRKSWFELYIKARVPCFILVPVSPQLPVQQRLSLSLIRPLPIRCISAFCIFLPACLPARTTVLVVRLGTDLIAIFKQRRQVFLVRGIQCTSLSRFHQVIAHSVQVLHKFLSCDSDDPFARAHTGQRFGNLQATSTGSKYGVASHG